MKRACLIFILLVIPLSSQAAWWDFLLPKASPKAATTSLATQGISGSLVKPTVEELQARISELERLLQDAESRLAKKMPAPTPAASVGASVKAAAQASSGGLSESQILAKAKPSMVFVETATSSGSGTFIDSQGRILTDAHIVWNQNSHGVVIGAAEQMTVTLSNGAKKSANLIGIDEAHDIAIIQVSSKSSSSYLTLTYDSNVAKGGNAYIFSLPALNGGGSGGAGFVSGIVTSKSASSVEINTEAKPLDTGGALINARGELVGIPNRSSCKVLEEMTNCLKYRVTADIEKTIIPKLVLGMRLYKERTGETPEESAVRDTLDTMYQTIRGGTIDFAVSSASGENSFDYFNNKLLQDKDGKIAKLYVLKLKQIAANFAQAADLLKSKSYDLSVFFINESANIGEMGSYQRAVLAKLQSDNSLKVKEYQAKLDYWTKKKNEYDSLILDATSVTHDYLMAEGAAEELETKYFSAEKQRILNTFSGETVNIF